MRLHCAIRIELLLNLLPQNEQKSTASEREKKTVVRYSPKEGQPIYIPMKIYF